MDALYPESVVGVENPARQLVTDLNRRELSLVSWLVTVVPELRASSVLAARGRSRSEAYRYVHGAGIAERMPALFELLFDDGRITVDHLDTVWLRINRHLVGLKTRVAESVRPLIDAAVSEALSDWIREGGPATLEAFSQVTDETLAAVAGNIVSATEQREQDTQRLYRRENRLILDCGSAVTADAVWSTVGDRALDLLREARRAEHDGTEEALCSDENAAFSGLPSMAQCRARVLLDLLGDTPATMKITVNLYRPTLDGRHGVGGAFIPGVGYVSDLTAGALEGVATLVRELPSRKEINHRQARGYTFTTLQKATVQGRDGHCRFPHCAVPAGRCEHDHIISSPHTTPESDGPTSVSNCMLLCRTHHALKTAGLWSASTPDDGVTVDWTGPDGYTDSTEADGPLAPLRSS